MIAVQQERLYQMATSRFPDWEPRQVGGYVHGVREGYLRTKPRQVYVRGSRKKRPEPYAVGYIYGFVDAFGADALLPLVQQGLSGIMNYRSYHRWWEKSENPS